MGLIGITLAHPEGGVLIDSRAYLAAAEDIRREGVLTELQLGGVHWPPGYAAFLAFVQGVTQTEFLGVVAAQLLSTGMACLLLLRVGTLLGEPLAGVVAAYIYALSPNAAMWALTIMSENVFAVLLVVALWAWLQGRFGRRTPWLGATGVVLGAASMVRPIGLPVIGLWGVVEARARLLSAGWRRVLLGVLVMVSGFAMIIAPWFLRNWVSSGEVLFSRGPWKAFVLFNLASVMAQAEGISRDEAAARLGDSVKSWTDAWDFIQAYPSEFGDQQLRGIVRTTVGVESGVWARVAGLELEEQGSFGILSLVGQGRLSLAWRELREHLTGERGLLLILAAAALLHSLASYGAGAGLLLGWNRIDPAIRPFVAGIALTVMYLMIVPGAIGQARFRIPAEPFLALLAGMGAVRWADLLQGTTGRRLSVRRSEGKPESSGPP